MKLGRRTAIANNLPRFIDSRPKFYLSRDAKLDDFQTRQISNTSLNQV